MVGVQEPKSAPAREEAAAVELAARGMRIMAPEVRVRKVVRMMVVGSILNVCSFIFSRRTGSRNECGLLREGKKESGQFTEL